MTANVASAWRPNLALRATEDHQLKMVTRPDPGPLGPDEALVHVRATGICGSDVHFWQHGPLDGWPAETKELAIGHESGGVVLAVGAKVASLQPGDRVAIEPGVPCRGSADACRHCGTTGRYNLCDKLTFASVIPVDGTMSRYHAHPAAFLHRVPDHVSFEEMALLEPLSVAMHAVRRASMLRPGQPAVIVGAGPVGIAILMVLEQASMGPVAIADLSEERLAFVRKVISPTAIICPLSMGDKPIESSIKIASAFAAIHKQTPTFLTSFECTGVGAGINTACMATARGGEVICVGMGHPTQNIPYMHLSCNEIDLRFVFRYKNTWPDAVQLVADGKIDVVKLVSHRFALEQAREAVELAADRSLFSIKTVVVDAEEKQQG